jgi:lipid-A-disaccharide synthase
VAEVLLIAGEPSGEEHAMTFIPKLLSLRPDLRLWGVGGDVLAARGMELKYHLRDFSSMGFSEVIGKIPFYRKALNDITAEAIKRGTKDAILVDFQDFNLRLAQRLAKHGIRVWYYVAPQAWAWRPWRAQTLAKTVHKLFTILPFESEWFGSRGVKNLVPVPHPLVTNWGKELALTKAKPWSERLMQTPRLMVLPGSRRSEVGPLLPLFMQTVRELKAHIPHMHVSLARVNHLDQRLYDCAQGLVDTWLTPEELPTHLLTSDAALAASGTVTLGTGMMGVPTVVAYQTSLINEFVIRHLIKYDRQVSLTNIILDDWVFPEYLQEQVQVPLMAQSVLSWWSNEAKWNKTMNELAHLQKLLQSGERSVGELMAKAMA